MQALITKCSQAKHRLCLVRRGASEPHAADQMDLETRSLLLHDLVHYAVEAEGPLELGFWGTLEQGATLRELWAHEGRRAPSPDLTLAETLVGPLQSVIGGRLSSERYVELAQGAGSPFPIDGAWVSRVRERVRKLMGIWAATPYGARLVLPWPPNHEPFIDIRGSGGAGG